MGWLVRGRYKTVGSVRGSWLEGNRWACGYPSGGWEFGRQPTRQHAQLFRKPSHTRSGFTHATFLVNPHRKNAHEIIPQLPPLAINSGDWETDRGATYMQIKYERRTFHGPMSAVPYVSGFPCAYSLLYK